MQTWSLMQSPSIVMVKWCLDIYIMSQNGSMYMFTPGLNKFDNPHSQNNSNTCLQNIIQLIILYDPSKSSIEQQNIFSLVDPDSNKVIQPHVTSCVSKKEEKLLTPERFERFSSWNSLHRAVAALIHIVQSFQSLTQVPYECSGWHQCSKPCTVSELFKAKIVILCFIQVGTFSEELHTTFKRGSVSKKSLLAKLSLFIDESGLLHVGSRLKLILPSRYHVSWLLMWQVEHQGRTFT